MLSAPVFRQPFHIRSHRLFQLHCIMPTTRSASRSSATLVSADIIAPTTATKRKAGSRTVSKAPPKRARVTGQPDAVPAMPDTAQVAEEVIGSPTPPTLALEHLTPINDNRRSLVPARLTFSFEEAKQHLIRVDPRFVDIFCQLKCKPYEHLEQFDPFSTLASSILGQQISWKAARSITHRFVRLFNSSLSEKPGEYNLMEFFPTAHQVVSMDHATLKSAGLSGRKAEYVLDLAARFADGRLTTEKLLNANDEELYEMLIAVRGIGKWTVDMFAIFSLRRPDILPVGDLGVQRGMARWFLALHSPNYNVIVSPEKLPKNPDDTSASQPSTSKDKDPDMLPTLGESFGVSREESHASKESPVLPVFTPPSSVSAPSTPVPKNKGKNKLDESGRDVEKDGTLLPPSFTPSIDRTLSAKVNQSGVPIEPTPLPIGLSATILKGRLNMKKKSRGAFLTPREMEDLTASWRPYRSLGVYYMWALAEGADTSDSL